MKINLVPDVPKVVGGPVAGGWSEHPPAPKPKRVSEMYFEN